MTKKMSAKGGSAFGGKKIIKYIYKLIYTGIVASMLGWAKSFGYKIEFKESDKEKRIESEK